MRCALWGFREAKKKVATDLEHRRQSPGDGRLSNPNKAAKPSNSNAVQEFRLLTQIVEHVYMSVRVTCCSVVVPLVPCSIGLRILVQWLHHYEKNQHILSLSTLD